MKPMIPPPQTAPVEELQVCITDCTVKMGNIPSVSLIPVIDCPPTAPCRDLCYGRIAWRLRPTVRAAWTRNSVFAHQDPQRYFQQVRGYLLHQEPEWFRWHVAGEIPNQAYLNEMIAIAKEFPKIRFLAFTKRHDLDYHLRPQNLAIVFSMWPGWGNPQDARRAGLPIAWLDNGQEPRIPQDAISCPGHCENCAMCWHLPRIGKDITFKFRKN